MEKGRLESSAPLNEHPITLVNIITENHLEHLFIIYFYIIEFSFLIIEMFLHHYPDLNKAL